MAHSYDTEPAPRVPRLHRLVGSAPACSADDCMQGRRECSDPGKCLTLRLTPIDPSASSKGRRAIRLFVLVLLMIIAAAAASNMTWCDAVSLLAAIGRAA